MSNPNLIGTLYKIDDESFGVSVDFSNWLAAGDTISTATVTCKYGTTDYSSTMIASVTDDNDDEVTFQVLGGTTGQMYLIEVKPVTSQADTWLAQLRLVVN